jgi:hypothetical protein
MSLANLVFFFIHINLHYADNGEKKEIMMDDDV